MSPELSQDDVAAIDPALIDWRATAEELQREVNRLQLRVAELEAGEIRTEWGVLWDGDGRVVRFGDDDIAEEAARRYAAMPPADRVLRREVRTGPWMDVDAS